MSSTSPVHQTPPPDSDTVRRAPGVAPQRFVVTARGRLSVMVFTDLDGTAVNELLPEAQRLESAAPAREAFRRIEASGMPVGILTARAAGEALHYRDRLGIHGPIICEDGAVIVLPVGATPPALPGTRVSMLGSACCLVLEGSALERIGTVLREAEGGAQERVAAPAIISTLFSDPASIRTAAGHATLDDARRSMARLASAYFISESPELVARVEALAFEAGLRVFGSPRSLQSAGVDKALALRLLDRHMGGLLHGSARVDGLLPIVVGNGENDLSALAAAQELGGLGLLVAHPLGGYFVPPERIPPGTRLARQAYGFGILEQLAAIFSFVDSLAGAPAREHHPSAEPDGPGQGAHPAGGRR